MGRSFEYQDFILGCGANNYHHAICPWIVKRLDLDVLGRSGQEEGWIVHCSIFIFCYTVYHRLYMIVLHHVSIGSLTDNGQATMIAGTLELWFR